MSAPLRHCPVTPPTPPQPLFPLLLCSCVHERLFRSMADRLASDGWVERGYNYLNLDDCWQAMSRDAAGKLQPDPARFPSGIPGALPHRLNRAVRTL